MMNILFKPLYILGALALVLGSSAHLHANNAEDIIPESCHEKCDEDMHACTAGNGETEHDWDVCAEKAKKCKQTCDDKKKETATAP